MSLTELEQVETSAAHVILEILEGEGVEYIFGIPGGPLTGFFEALHARKRIRFVLAKHEGGAAFMAAAYARVTGRLAVCCVTTGPGVTNAITGVASAYTDGLPVLILTGQVSTQVFGKGAIQESSAHGLDIVDAMRAFTLESFMLPSVGRVPDLLRSAIRTAMSARRGPVHVSMPADFLSRPVRGGSLNVDEYRSRSTPVDRAGLEAVAQLLRTARRPLLLAGHGVALAGASNELLSLATELGLPVATTPKGKGTFPEDHPLSVGVLGFGGHQLPERYLEAGGADLLLVVGSSLNEFVTNGWTVPFKSGRKLIQLDIDARVLGRNYRVDLAVVGDARASLAELLALFAARPEPPPYEREFLAALRTKTPRYLAADMIESDATPIKPQRLIAELRAAMPESALLFVDNGTSIIWATHYFEARRPNTYFIDLGLASMGSAVAGVIGGALGARGRRAVALVGDAAFAMNGMEVHTAVELGLPVTWVVLNNGGHGMVYQGETLMKGATFGTSLFRMPIDSAALGAALGARGVRAATPDELRCALRDSLSAEGPTVIDAMIDPNEMAPTLVSRAQTLAQFFALGRRTDPPQSLRPLPASLSAPPVSLPPFSSIAPKPGGKPPSSDS
ncbi:MAG TPA: thiamine pyrophosphate-binding protein [Polyangiaceae bacterium]|nr:thiamine pyrophosphate-binding protein [Polyangiaceae bacterium]